MRGGKSLAEGWLRQHEKCPNRRKVARPFQLSYVDTMRMLKTFLTAISASALCKAYQIPCVPRLLPRPSPFASDAITPSRRHFGIIVAITAVSVVTGRPVPAVAGTNEDDITAVQPLSFTRKTDQFAYEFQPPSSCSKPANKPLKTHLDEIIFKCETIAGYEYGITIDPVRINSLQEFGTPEQVAAKVVLAEVNRDGVFDVTLMEDAYAGMEGEPGLVFYQINYQSKGKRGVKRFVAKFYIQNQKLYALTAQCKELDYPSLESEIQKAVQSFRVI